MGLPSLAGVEALVHIHPVVRGLPIASFHCRVGFAPALCLAAALLDGTAKCPESLCPMSVFPHWGDVYAVSCKKSPQVASSPCCHRDLPDVISANLSSDAWSLTTAVPRGAYTCFFLRVIGLPPERSGSASRFYPRIRLLAGGVFEAADISLCSGLRVCSSPRSFLPLLKVPQGSRDFYIRAERASLPLHAPDMLAVRIQAIDGTRTSTLSDSQPCRPLHSPPPHTAWPSSRELPVDPCRDHRWGFPCCVWSPMP